MKTAIRRLALKFGRPFDRDFLALLPLAPELDGGLALDVGAHRGLATDAILRFLPNSPVVLFEPNAIAFGRLAARYARNPRVTVHDFALGDRSGSTILHVPCYRGRAFAGLGSLGEAKAARSLGGQLLWLRPEHFRLEGQRCGIQTLDGLNLRPRFIKLDVQGHELPVLIGAEETLRLHRPLLLVESVHPSLLDYVRPLGYRPHAFDGHGLKPGLGRINTFLLA